jgi:hypothetical protein
MDKFNELALVIENKVRKQAIIEKVAEVINEEDDDTFTCSECQDENFKTWKEAKIHVADEHVSENEFALISMATFSTLTYLKEKNLIDTKRLKTMRIKNERT